MIILKHASLDSSLTLAVLRSLCYIYARCTRSVSGALALPPHMQQACIHATRSSPACVHGSLSKLPGGPANASAPHHMVLSAQGC